MSKSLKSITMGITIWLVLYLGFIVVYTGNMSLKELTQIPLALIVVHLITMVLIFGAIVFSSIHLYNNSQVDDQPKLIWFVGILFMGVFVMPFYWKKYIW